MKVAKIYLKRDNYRALFFFHGEVNGEPLQAKRSLNSNNRRQLELYSKYDPFRTCLIAYELAPYRFLNDYPDIYFKKVCVDKLVITNLSDEPINIEGIVYQPGATYEFWNEVAEVSDDETFYKHLIDKLFEHNKEMYKLWEEKGTYNFKKCAMDCNLAALKLARIREAQDEVFLLEPCPICRAKPHIEHSQIVCSENCPAPKCEHLYDRDIMISWNTWVKWYRNYNLHNQNSKN